MSIVKYTIIIVIITILLLESFSYQCYLMVFHWSLMSAIFSSLWDSSQYSGRFQQSNSLDSLHPSRYIKSSSLCNNPLVTVPSATITIGIIVNFMFHSFFNSFARSMYLTLFSHSFKFTLWFAGTTKFIILQIHSFLLIIKRSGYLAEIK